MAEDGFLARWARRKNAAASGVPETDPDEIARAEAEARAVEEEAGRTEEVGRTEAEARAEAHAAELEANRAAAEAVDLETIDEKSDVSVFLKEGVPALLKQAALRKLWRSNPVFANIDGLNDYDTDFTGTGTTLEKVATRWQVGKGFEKTQKIAERIEDVPAPSEAAEDEVQVDAVAEVEGAQAMPADAPVPAEDAAPGKDDDKNDDETGPVRVSLRRRYALEDWPEG